jgi:hypothetical protein
MFGRNGNTSISMGRKVFVWAMVRYICTWGWGKWDVFPEGDSGIVPDTFGAAKENSSDDLDKRVWIVMDFDTRCYNATGMVIQQDL